METRWQSHIRLNILFADKQRNFADKHSQFTIQHYTLVGDFFKENVNGQMLALVASCYLILLSRKCLQWQQLQTLNHFQVRPSSFISKNKMKTLGKTFFFFMSHVKVRDRKTWIAAVYQLQLSVTRFQLHPIWYKEGNSVWESLRGTKCLSHWSIVDSAVTDQCRYDLWQTCSVFTVKSRPTPGNKCTACWGGRRAEEGERLTRSSLVRRCQRLDLKLRKMSLCL